MGTDFLFPISGSLVNKGSIRGSENGRWGVCPHFGRDALGMAVRALDPVYVVLALRRAECGIHLFHIQSAIRHFRMTLRTGGPGLLAMLQMAGQTTDAFVHADRGSIVACSHLSIGLRGVALVT